MNNTYSCQLNWSTILISGNNVADFLQGQLSCDLQQLQQQSSLMGAYCDRKGRLQASFIIAAQGDNFIMALPSDNSEHCCQLLHKFGVFSGITTAPCNGPLIGLSNATAPSQAHLCYPTPGRWLLIGEQAEQWQQQNQLTADQSQWLRDDMHAGLLWIEHRWIDQFTPAMLHYDHWHAISISKGCYLGQEIIMRTAKLGTPKRGLYQFQTATPVTLGQTIQYQEQSIGIVVLLDPTDPQQGLAVLQHRYLDYDNHCLNVASEPKLDHCRTAIAKD